MSNLKTNKMETNTNSLQQPYIKAENTGRQLFCNQFKEYYNFCFNPISSSTDVCFSSCHSNKQYIAEIKVRNIDVEQYSGSTLLEQKKLLELIIEQSNNPSACVVYVNYYNDNNLIVFDITNRIKTNSPDISTIWNIELPSTTARAGRNEDKNVYFLSYTSNETIKDKIFLKK